MDLIIVRHGRPLRVEGTEGSADPPLTDIGMQQAEATARFLLQEPIDHVVTSPMLRARQTAAPLADALGIDPEVIDGLAEIDRDHNEYIPMEELKAQGGDAWKEVIENPHAMLFGVDVEEFADTVTAAFEEVIAANPGRTVAVFCHSMTTVLFVRRVLGYADIWGLRTDYASITRVQASSRGHRTVRSVNETSHLGDTRILSP